jgi:hypothetical protein
MDLAVGAKLDTEVSLVVESFTSHDHTWADGG